MFLVIRHYIGTEQQTKTRYYISTQEEYDYTWAHIDHGCNVLTIVCYCDTRENAELIVMALDIITH